MLSEPLFKLSLEVIYDIFELVDSLFTNFVDQIRNSAPEYQR